MTSLSLKLPLMTSFFFRLRREHLRTRGGRTGNVPDRWWWATPRACGNVRCSKHRRRKKPGRCMLDGRSADRRSYSFLDSVLGDGVSSSGSFVAVTSEAGIRRTCCSRQSACFSGNRSFVPFQDGLSAWARSLERCGSCDASNRHHDVPVSMTDEL